LCRRDYDDPADLRSKPTGSTSRSDDRSFPRGKRGPKASRDGSYWNYVTVRRLFVFVEESVYDGTQWVVFEPNGAIPAGGLTAK
jgi:hypothetical protein